MKKKGKLLIVDKEDKSLVYNHLNVVNEVENEDDLQKLYEEVWNKNSRNRTTTIIYKDYD